MPEDEACEPHQHSVISERKKKKRNKAPASTCAPGNTEKPLAALSPESLPLSLLPPPSLGQSQDLLPKLRAPSKKNGKWLHDLRSKDSLTANLKSGSGDPAQGYATERSLRWEGVLQDPQAEAKRLEKYRASRRQRYIAHREALFKETQDALRQTFPKEKEAPTKSNQQDSASLLQLSRD